MLGQRLDATHNKIQEIAGRLQGKDARRLTVLAMTMRKIAIRWAHLYHNELEQANATIEEQERQYQALAAGMKQLRKEHEQ